MVMSVLERGTAQVTANDTGQTWKGQFSGWLTIETV